MEYDRTSSPLERIADALGVRVSEFTQGRSRNESAQFYGIGQQAEILQLFAEITDPNSRLKCLEYVRALASVNPKTARP